MKQSLTGMLASKARTLRSAVRGNALLTTTFMLVPMIGMIGLGTDTAQWYLWKLQLQRQADSAALAGAYAVSEGRTGTALTSVVTTDLELNRDRNYTVVAIENAPKGGSKAGSASAVRVILSTQESLPFSSFFLRTAPVIRVSATAEFTGQSPTCILSLLSASGTGLEVSGSATIDLGCAMQSNALGATSLVTGSGLVNASALRATGSIVRGTGVSSSTPILPNQPAFTDPYATIPNPVWTGSPGYGKVSVDSGRTRSLSPGFYNELEIKGTANLAPGIYYIADGGLRVRGGATINGNGVTIVLTSRTGRWDPAQVGDLDIAGNSTVNLTAPTTGPYAGLVLYRDRRANLENGTPVKISGNNVSLWQGSVYAPTSNISFTGNTGMNTDCNQIVGYRVTFTGNSRFRNICPPDSGSGAFGGGSTARLVE